ncbi:flagellar basal body P-ring protein FlgI [Chromobacterium violaceum]|uniref:Flagellar P-ring protein 2 n=2 Tax=Chromobacterium violaceum TaxID=536 RepID=FLGI2_CHRVO|nr:flagellar basal body P-ring protein FlgI [Chromobacterium violaceum]Q7NU22.1 RecName: Full=Flagellar P-ring protein 2; AltName: Full=Basal body P-ring protein 2; Flags: Precursor [Chromobacterium violaceum ATCC 12472]AAQ60549.1 flagellar P-ring protein precursor flgI [Chromobacterium violaceum ATCC 12472]ATP29246.1 flagellar P-ring protein [Chromobacterium violaceum]ATP33153.1 flagellar P-ring protein [Chromobacterium violaceum]KJH68415.1 flagellar P-ring protein FlgI [Chromobacterium viola
MKKWIVMASLLLAALPAMSAQRLKDIANIGGVRPNQLIGYGLVVGLDGSGDKVTSSPFTGQAMINMLNQLGVQVPPGTKIDPKNVAAVTLTATLPPFSKRGQMLDVTASSIGDAKSLRGGTLLLSPLKGADGQIYAMAQGNVVVGGAGASAGGSSTQINQLSVGRIPSGATVEREVQTALGDGEFIHLELQESDFTTANRAVQAINKVFGGDTARAVDGRLIEVRAPFDSNQRVQFLSRMENIAVDPADLSPLVIINARTGSIVMNQAVTLGSCAVSHGNLSVTVNNTPQVSQPNPLSGGKTVVTNQADITINSTSGKVVGLKGGANLSQVVNALNALGATPQDLISILQAMKSAGSLKADLQII